MHTTIRRRGFITGLVATPFIIPSPGMASLGGGFCPPASGAFGSGVGGFVGSGGAALPVEDYTGHLPAEGPPERFLSVRCVHTGDSFSGQYVSGGQYIAEALDQLNWATKDWRHREPTNMDPYLWDILFALDEMLGTTSPWLISSGYRNPATNASVGGARQSFHMRGKALDVCKGDKNPRQIQAAGRALQQRRGRSGVGHYSSFTHLDSRGSVATWTGS